MHSAAERITWFKNDELDISKAPKKPTRLVVSLLYFYLPRPLPETCHSVHVLANAVMFKGHFYRNREIFGLRSKDYWFVPASVPQLMAGRIHSWNSKQQSRRLYLVK